MKKNRNQGELAKHRGQPSSPVMNIKTISERDGPLEGCHAEPRPAGFSSQPGGFTHSQAPAWECYSEAPASIHLILDTFTHKGVVPFLCEKRYPKSTSGIEIRGISNIEQRITNDEFGSQH